MLKPNAPGCTITMVQTAEAKKYVEALHKLYQLKKAKKS
jgi:hypothetical protein